MKNCKGGFTLIEILIASSILSIILAVLYSTFFISQKAVNGLDESIVRLQECRAALNMIRKEIDSSFYRSDDKKTLFKLEDRDIYAMQTSRIIFTSISPLRQGVSEINYHVKESDNNLILYKEVSSPYGQKEGPHEADIIENISEFFIEARYGDKWVKTWDSALMNKLPDEVRISLKVKIKERDVILSEKARPRMM